MSRRTWATLVRFPSEGVVEIPLTQGKFALIDEPNLELVAGFKWNVIRTRNCWYAVTRSNGKRLYLHHAIMGDPNGREIDHIDGDGLNNRMRNMRWCAHHQNLANQRISKDGRTSRYRGVYWASRDRRWVAQTKHIGVGIHIGTFTSEVVAAYAYDQKVRELKGEFAVTNFA